MSIMRFLEQAPENNLFSTTWLKTSPIETDAEGPFTMQLPALEKGKEYEFRAVVIHPQLTVRGDVKRPVVK